MSQPEKQVAAVMFRALFTLGARFGVPIEQLVSTAQYKRELLMDGRRRYPWADYVAVLEEFAASVGGYPSFRELAAHFPEGVPKDIAALFRVFVSPTTVYHFVYNVLDPLVLPMCHHASVPLDDGRVRVEFRIQPGYVSSEAAVWGTVGSAEGIPRYIGLEPSQGEVLDLSSRHVVLVLTPPPARTLLSRVSGSYPAFSPKILREIGEKDELALTQASLNATVAQLEEHDAVLEREIEQRETVERALAQVLATTASPAFFVTGGNVMPANEQGRVAIAAEGRALRTQILTAVAVPDASGEFLVMKSGRPSEAVVLYQSVTAESRRRAQAATERWNLTPRQREVLEGLIKGLTNAEMAVALGCTTRTVEAHVTALLQRADVTSRLALVSAFWSEL